MKALLAAVLLAAGLVAGCGGNSAEQSSVDADVVPLIEDVCIFNVTEGVGLDGCYPGFERVAVTDCKKRDPMDGGGRYDCIAEDLATGERLNIRVITYEDDVSAESAAAHVVVAEDVR